MPTLDNRLNPTLILRELGKMNVAEMENVLRKLHRLAATKKGALRPNEARLLETINATLPPDQRASYRRLVSKRKNGTLTPAEHRELVQLSDALEILHASRVQSVIKLAALRKVAVPELMAQLGLESLATHG